MSYKNIKILNSTKLFSIVIVFALLSFTTVHKYYISVTQIEYVKEKQSVQVIIQLFIDDFEKLIQKRYDENIILADDKEPEQLNFYIEKYLKEKIQIKINNNQEELVYLGKEYEDDIIYCYLEINNVYSINSFEIINQVLFDLFDEQQNIVKTNINSKNRSLILIPENDKGVLNFN